MKKLVAISIVAAMLLASGAAFAQSSQQHDVTVRIPEALMIRITGGSGNAAATDPAVTFDYLSGTGYFAAVETEAGGWLAPTETPNFVDVRVFANRGGWSVAVSAVDFTFVPTDGSSEEFSALPLSRIRVTPVTAGSNVNLVLDDGSFNLASGTIANGTNATQGWQSLGFGGNNYEFFVDGTEEAGTYTTQVTYAISAP